MENKKLNVLVVHNYYKYPGGEGNVVENEIELLKENGHSIFLYSRNNNEIDKFNILQKILLPLNYLFNIRTYFDVIRIIRKNDIDIVHVHNTINIISKSVYYAANKCNVPIVQTVHNFRFLCPNGLLFRNNNICEECINDKLFCAIKYKCYRNSLLETIISVFNIKQLRHSKIMHKINYICLSEFNKNKLLLINRVCRKEVIDPSKIYIKSNFVDDRTGFLPMKDRDDYYVYASRLEESKGIKDLLEVWKYMKNEKLKIFGDGSLKEWCIEYIKNNNLSNIEFIGQVSKKQVIEAISKSKALVFCTKFYEGMPLTIIEAFSTGTPVIAPSMGNSDLLVNNGINGYKYKFNDNNDFIYALKQQLNDSLYANAYNEYLEKYSRSINYDTMIAIYYDVIRKNKAGI